MRAHDPKIDVIEHIELFYGCSKREARLISSLADQLERPAGSVLIQQGAHGGEAFVLVAGQVTVERDGEVISTLGPGTVIGEISLLDHTNRTATVVAATDVTLLVLDPRSFKRLLNELPWVETKVVRELGRRRPDPQDTAPV